MSTVILLNDDSSKIRMHKITDAFSARRCGSVYLGVDVLGVCEVFYVY